MEPSVTVVATGKTTNLVIEQRPGALTKSQVEDARRAMMALKFHPRESLPNRTALARADALFIELSGMERHALAGAISRFQAALESQDVREFEPARERLLLLVADLDNRR